MGGRIGIIGGTGPEGKALAARFAHAGRDVVLGSRSMERALEAAGSIAVTGSGTITGNANGEVARDAEVIIVTLPYEALSETLKPLAEPVGSKIVVSTVTPLRFASGRADIIKTERGSAAEDVQLFLPNAAVIAAFQNLAARKLADISNPLEADVIVCGNDSDALREVMALAELIDGVRGVNGGALRNSRYVEGITALLVTVNRIHRTETAIRLVGI